MKTFAETIMDDIAKWDASRDTLHVCFLCDEDNVKEMEGSLILSGYTWFSKELFSTYANTGNKCYKYTVRRPDSQVK